MNFGVQFYPTPKRIAEKMWDKIKWNKVNTLLEPSAGKGDLLSGINERRKDNWGEWVYTGNRRADYIDCVEIDPNLAAILREKGYNVTVADFLTHDTYTRYDCIIMNPPFANGDRHLLKALDLCKFGGQVCAIINAETLRNAYTDTRNELVQKLTDLNADIEYVDNAFKGADVDRQADVDIAIVYVNIPKVEYDFDIFKGMVKAEDYESVYDNIDNSCTLATNDGIANAIRAYNDECRIGLSLIDNFERMNKLIPHTAKTSEYDSSYSLLSMSVRCKEEDSKLSLQNQFLRALRDKYWNILFNSREISKLLTNKTREQLYSELQNFRAYDFTLSNIKALQIRLSAHMSDSIEEAIMRQFDNLTYKHSMSKSSNAHYYNGWKTNDAFAINKKVIIPCYGMYTTYGSCGYWSLYRAADTLDELEKVLTYLNGGVRPEGDDARTVVNNVDSKGYYGQRLHTSFFDFECKLKGTIHVWFNDLDLLKKFNIYAGRKKGFLPNDYGSKKYADLDGKEKQIADEFEGAKSYADTNKNITYYTTGVSMVALAMNN